MGTNAISYLLYLESLSKYFSQMCLKFKYKYVNFAIVFGDRVRKMKIEIKM